MCFFCVIPAPPDRWSVVTNPQTAGSASDWWLYDLEVFLDEGGVPLPRNGVPSEIYSGELTQLAYFPILAYLLTIIDTITRSLHKSALFQYVITSNPTDTYG